MSGFEALSMASSVLQVISFAIDMAGICKAVYDGATADDSIIHENVKDMTTANARMMEYTTTLTLKDDEEIALNDIAIKCNNTVKKIKDEVDKIDRKAAKGSLLRSARAAIKYRTKRSMLQGLQTELSDQKSTMKLQLLVRILNKNDVMQVLQTKRFDTTSTSLQKLASDLVDGKKDLQDFITQGNAELEKQMKAESARLETSLKQYVSEEAQKTLSITFSESQRQVIRSSTKYPEMNERLNQIDKPFTNTYRWVLDQGKGVSLGEYKFPSSGESVQSEKSWPSFVEWAESDHQMRWYWISGNPGSGKSTLLKFLSEHRKTQRLLSHWRPEVRILKHYFWKPGNKMQCSVKGFWCSLAHQLLSLDDRMANQALENSSTIRQKSVYHDWSESELKDLCMDAFSDTDLAYCIFADGLDEVSDSDGAEPLLKALDDIQHALGDRVKLCVSSRLEFPFLKKIGLSWQLKLHLLTDEDLNQYLWERLDKYLPSDASYRPNRISKPGHILMRKAEGVFLWLVLALEDVERGLRNEDTDEEIISRAERLPSGINDLYQEMWSRLNEDDPIYRASAATMLMYMVTRQQHMVGEHGTSGTLLELCFGLDLAPAVDVLEGKCILDTDDLTKLRSKVTRMINVRCAGLLQIGRNLVVAYGDDIRYYDHSRRDRKDIAAWTLDPFATVVDRNAPENVRIEYDTVHFVHRTAFDYLTTTDHGRSIVGYTRQPDGAAALRVARSFLAYARCVEKCKPGEPWNTFHKYSVRRWLPLMSTAMEHGDERVVQSSTDLLALCSRLYESSLELSGDSDVYAPLASHLMRYSIMSPFALERLKASETTRVLSWHIVVLEPKMFEQQVASKRGLLSENVQKCVNLGLQWDLRILRPIGFDAYWCQRDDILLNNTVFEDLALRLLNQLCGDVSYSTNLSDIYDVVETLSIRQPSANDMGMALLLTRKTCPDHWVDDYNLAHRSRSDTLSSCQIDVDYKHVFKTSDRPTYEKSRFHSNDHLRLNIIIEANLSYLIWKVSDYVSRLKQPHWKEFSEFRPLRALVELQERSIAPSAKVLYVLGEPFGDSSNPADDQGGTFAYSCNFDSEGHKVLLDEAGCASEDAVIDRINDFLMKPGRFDDMTPMDGRVMENLARSTPWYCMADEVGASA